MVSLPHSPSLINWAEQKQSNASNQIGFTQYLNAAIHEVNALQKEADQAAIKVVTGEMEEIHQAVIAAEKASLSMQLALQVRNKVLEAYQEIIRMPV
ncbi:MAG: flagellar hook-basal body complex protein FliE [Syntrophomonadaceae bacterium]|nr:flagellar hook-basal body complex protein FliE [Syntrophomonadaceae bacterium]